MSNPTYNVQFVPSGAPATFTPTTFFATPALPTVDGTNVDLMVTSTASTPVFLTLGAAVQTVGSTLLSGNIMVPPGETILLVNTAATAAASVNPNVINGSAGALTTIGAVTGMTGGTVTCRRGTATVVPTF